MISKSGVHLPDTTYDGNPIAWKDADDSDEGLRRLWDENAKLRYELADAPKCETCEAMLDCDECLRADGSHKERRRLSAENAKLRELMGDLYGEYRYLRVRHHRMYLQHEERMRAIESRMRDLGVEVE